MSKVYFSGFYPSESAAGQKGSAAFLSSLNTATIYLYRRSTSVLTSADLPIDTITYTFETAAITGLDPLSPWKYDIPEGTDPLYIIMATATSYEAIDTILTADWTDPVLFAQSGLSSATVFLFQRTSSDTPPSAPSVTTTYDFATGVLTGINNGWTQTAPDSSGGRYLYVTTAFAVGSGETDEILTGNWATVKLLSQDGIDGTDAYTVYLSNENHTVPADSSGAVTTYSGASGTFAINKNENSIASNFTLSSLSNPQNLSVTYTGNSYTITGGLDTAESSATLTIRATGSGTYEGLVFDKVFTLNKSKAGTDGTPAKLLTVTASRQIVTYDGTGAADPVDQTIVFTANKQNTTATVTWAVKDSLGFTLDASNLLSATTGDSVTMTTGQFAAALSYNGARGIIVTGTLTDGITLYDTITVSKVMNGSDGSDGAPGLTTALIYIYQRASSTPSVPSVDATYNFSTKTITGLNNGWSSTIPAGTSPVYVSLATASTTAGSTTDTITSGEWTSPVVLVQNGTDGAPALNSATVYLYQRNFTRVAPALPTSSLTYTFSTGTLTGTGLNGWSRTIPSESEGDCIFVTTATAASTSSTDTILASEWAAAQILSQDGYNGSNGVSTAVLQMYQWAANAPTTYPSGTSVYTWSTGTFTSPGTPNGWTINPGTPVAGQKLWGIRQIYTTYFPGSTNNVTWSANTVFAVGAAGTDGSPGAAGTRGSKQFYTSGTSWSDTTANNAITSAGFTKVTLDSVTISSTNFAQTRYWDGSAWVLISTVIDGNLLVAGTVAADKIDSRGLSIKDAAGNIILAAGSPLAASNITPASGWLNSNVNITGSNGTISLTGAGTGSATGIIMPGNQITSGNVSTYIASAAIGEAYIGNLSAAKITTGELSANRINVDGITLSRSGDSLLIKGAGVNTPQLADNAATVGRYVVGSATTYITASTGSTPVQVASITFTPTYIGAGNVLAIINWSARVFIDGTASGTTGNNLVEIGITEDLGGGILWGVSFGYLQSKKYSDGEAIFGRGNITGVTTLVADPSVVGTPVTIGIYYRMYNITPTSSTSCGVQLPTIQVLETKK